MMLDLISTTLMLIGAGFFFAGTVGLLRFPDVYSRLHALTKADNLGVGFIAVAAALQADGLAAGLKLLLVWPLVLLASAAMSYAIAERAKALGVPLSSGTSADRP
jgi:multicomponent Na+:H+ antiporter subunit G